MIKKGLLLNAGIEIIGGLVLLFRPSMLTTESNTCIVNILSLAAICLGAISYMVHLSEDENLQKKIALLFLIYHSILAAFLYKFYSENNVPDIMPFSIHAFMALCFIYILVKK